MTHEEAKRLYLAYRAKAKEMIAKIEGERLTVSNHANVQMTEDGAFVECTVWVPKEVL